METWRVCPSCPWVEVSDGGRVRSKAGELSFGRNSRSGHSYVKVARRARSVGALVLETFVGPAPTGKPEARRLDGDPANDRLSNLAWGDRFDIGDDKRRRGTHENMRRSTCRRRGHALVEPNLESWTWEKRGGRKCYACRRAATIVFTTRAELGLELDHDLVADAFYERLMAGRPSPTSAELRELVASEPRQPATTLEVFRHSFPAGSEVVADDLLCEAQRFAVPTSRNAVHTALRRAVERGLAERVGRGRVRVLV